MDRRSLFGALAGAGVAAVPGTALAARGRIDAIMGAPTKDGWWCANLHLPDGTPITIGVDGERKLLEIARRLTNLEEGRWT